MTVQRNGDVGEGRRVPLVPPPVTVFPEVPVARVVPRPAATRPNKVSLVVPAMNEATNIAWVLDQVPELRRRDRPRRRALPRRDGDRSRGRSVPDIQVVAQSGRGKGDALRAGFLAATGELIVMIDADGSMAPQEIPHFLHFLANGYDFVKGSRFMGGGGSRDITRLRRGGNRALVGLVNRLYGTSLTDLCYGYLAFHRRFLPFLDLTRPGFEVETLADDLRAAGRPAHGRGAEHGDAAPLRAVEPPPSATGRACCAPCCASTTAGSAGTPCRRCAASSTSATRPGASLDSTVRTDPGEVLT